MCEQGELSVYSPSFLEGTVLSMKVKVDDILETYARSFYMLTLFVSHWAHLHCPICSIVIFFVQEF